MSNLGSVHTGEHVSRLSAEPAVALRGHKPHVSDFSRAVRLFNAKILIFHC